MNYLRYLAVSVAFVFIALLATAHEKTNEPKVTADVVWMTNLEEAQKISAKTKKPILANFTGSDWCGWCHKLSAEVFNTPEFKKWSDSNVVLLELDYPKTKAQPDQLKAQNSGLMQAFQVQGFPTIWVFNLDIDKTTKKFNITQIGKTGYMRGGPVVFTGAIDGMITQFKNAKNTNTQGPQKVKS